MNPLFALLQALQTSLICEHVDDTDSRSVVHRVYPEGIAVGKLFACELANASLQRGGCVGVARIAAW